MASTFNWQGEPSKNGAGLQKCGRYVKGEHTTTKLFAGLRDPVYQPGNICIVGAEQGTADHNRRDALKRCIPMREAA